MASSSMVENTAAGTGFGPKLELLHRPRVHVGSGQLC